MCKQSAFEWQEQRKKQRQQRGSKCRRLLKALPVGRLQDQSILGGFLQPVWCDTLHVRKAYAPSAPNMLTIIS